MFRQLFEVAIQAAIGGRVIARETYVDEIIVVVLVIVDLLVLRH